MGPKVSALSFFLTFSLCFPFGPLVSRQDGNLPRAGGRTGGCQSKSVHVHPPHSAPTAAEHASYSTPKQSKVTVSTTASSVRHSGYWHQKRLFHQWTQETTEDDSINCIQWARRNCQMSHPCNLQRDREKEKEKKEPNPKPASAFRTRSSFVRPFCCAAHPPDNCHVGFLPLGLVAEIPKRNSTTNIGPPKDYADYQSSAVGKMDIDSGSFRITIISA